MGKSVGGIAEELDEAETEAPEDETDTEEEEENESGADHRSRRFRGSRRQRGRRPAIEQTVIYNAGEPEASPMRVDIQPGVGRWLVGRSIIGFREAFDIGGGERPGISFQVLVLDDGSQWRLRGSEDFDGWLERLLPEDDA